MRKARTLSNRLFPALLLLHAVAAGAGWGQGAEGLYQAGSRAFQDGLYPMASRNFQSLVDQYPDSALADDAEYLRALSDFYSGDYRRSIATLLGFERRFPRSPNLRRVSYWLGAAHYHLGEDREALRFLDQQIAGYPEEQFYADHARLLRALALERLARWNDAAEGLRQVLNRASAGRFHAEALFRLGGVQLRTEDYTGALTSFGRLIVDFPDSPYAGQAPFYAAEAAFFAGRGAEAERRYRGVLAGGPALSAEQQESSLYRLALILSKRGALGEALGLCEDLERGFPDGQYRQLLPRLKADLLYDLGRFAEAAAGYRRALALAGGPEERQGVAYNLGLAAELGGSPGEAVEAFRIASGAGGTAGEQALYRLGYVLSTLGRDAEAVSALRDFDARYPSSSSREAAARLLAFVHRRSGQAEASEELYTRLLARYPSSAHRDEYLFGRATVRLERGDTSGALKDFFALVEQLPASRFAAESRYHLGYVYSERGEYKRAMEYFGAVLKPPASAGSPGQPADAELRGRTILAAGVCAYNAGEYSESVRWFSQNVSEGAWAAESWLYLGRAHYKMDRLEEASRSFAEAARLLGDSVHAEEALFWQGLCLFRLNRLADAKAAFLETARRYPQGTRRAESLYRAGVCATQEKRYAESIGYYEQALAALRSLPGAGGTSSASGSAVASPDLRLAPAALRSLPGAGGYVATLEQEILYQKGWSAFRAGDRAQAAASFEALAGSYPGSTLAAEAFFKLAEEDFRAGETGRALRGFLEVRERFPGSDAAAAALYWAGVSHARLGQAEKALEHLLRYLDSADSREGALRELAVGEIRSVLRGQSSARPDSGVVETFYRRAEASPALPVELKNQVRFEYARSLFDVQPERALALLETLRGSGLREPLRGEVAFLTGEYYRRTGDLPRARDIFVGVVASSAEESAALAQLGVARILEAQNRKVEAAEEYLKAYFLYPDFRQPAQEGLFQAGRVYWESGSRDKGRQLFEKLSAEFPDSVWLDKRPDR